jgi:VCBS repeat-containing protein
MATYLFSAVKGKSIRFNATSDVLRFDSGSAADLNITVSGSTLILKLGTEFVTFTNLSQPRSLTSTNITFADGSMLLNGDNATGSTNDNGANTLIGGVGNDMLIGYGGNDFLDGREGSDTYVITGANDGTDLFRDTGTSGIDRIVVSANNAVINLGANFSTVLTGIEAISANGYTGVRINGSGNADALNFTGVALSGITLIDAQGGADNITGSDGDDIIKGGTGNDTIDGGAGRDTAVYAGTMASYSITKNGNIVQVRDLDAVTNGNDGTDTLQNVELLQFLDSTVDLTPPSNNAPVAVADNVGTDANSGPITIDVLANDTDADTNDTRLVVAVDGSGTADAPPIRGTVQVAADGLSIVYNAAGAFDYLQAGETATETLRYTIADAAGAVSTATVNITIAGVNDGPFAVGDTAAAVENGAPVNINVLANDIDPDLNDTRVVVAVNNTGLQGTASVAAGGTSVNYTIGNAFQSLRAGQTATETFSYTMADAAGAQSSASVTVTITGANDGPQAVADTVTAIEDQASYFNILTNDTDPDAGDTIRLVSIDRTGTAGATAFATVGGVQHIYYVPVQSLGAGVTATDHLSYTIADAAGALSTAQVTILVTGVNDAPVAFSDTASALANGGTITINALTNDTDADIGDTKTILSVDGNGRPGGFYLVQNGEVTFPVLIPAIPAILGTASIAAGGQGIVYTPGSAFASLRAGATATETIFYTMADSAGVQASSTAVVTVTGVNDGPTARADFISLAKNAAPVAINVLANDTDIDIGDTKTVVSFDATGTLGTIALGLNGGNIIYTVGTAFQGLANGASATDTFRYTMRDGSGAESSAQVTVNIFSNTAPVAVNDTASATENGSSVVINVLANDTDVNVGDSKTVVAVNNTGTQGVASVAASGGSVTYTIGNAFQSLRAGVTATDSFEYTMADSGGAQSTARVDVTVTGVNDAPIAVADGTVVAETAGQVFVNVLANDIDVDAGDTLTVLSLTTTGLKGSAIIAPGGTGILYTPYQSLLAGQTGTDTFTYRVVDSAGAQSTSTVTMTVTGANGAAPVAVADVRTLTEDSPATTILVLANDTDADVGDTKRVIAVDNTGLQGTVSVAANGTGVVYTPGNAFQSLLTGQSATEIFSYTMADSGGATASATVTVTINGITDAPTAVADSYVTTEDGGSKTIYVLANDLHGDLDPTGELTVTSVIGTEQFAAVTLILIYGVGVGEFHAGFPRLLGEAAISPDGHSVIYTPLQSLNAGETGVDQFKYTLTGGSTGVVSVTVTGANDAPVAFDDSAAIASNSAPITIDVLANDTDPDTRIDPPQPLLGEQPDGGFVWSVTPADIPDTKTVVAVNGSGLQGTASIAAGGTGVVYAIGGTLLNLNFGQSSIETFSYTMRDSFGAESTANVRVTVTGVNHTPTAVNDTAAATENGAPVIINVLANDTDSDTAAGDTLAVKTVNGAGLQGSVAIQGSNIVYNVGNAFQSLGAGATATENFSYTLADLSGAQSTANVAVTVTGVNDAPIAAADSISVSEDAGAVAIAVLANDMDVDAGDIKTVTSVNSSGLQGSVAITADGTSVIYTVANAFQSLLTGQFATETFSYTMRDSAGAQSTAAVTVNIIGADEPVVIVNPPEPGPGAIVGSAGNDILNGTSGADVIYGQGGADAITAGNGDDVLFGGADKDTLTGDAGNDTLNGGAGRDDMTGGTGADIFRFYLASESTLIDLDRIRDFTPSQGDKLDLSFIDANTVLGGNNDFTLGGASFTGVAGQLIQGTTASGYLVQGDVNGDAIADFAVEIRLVGVSSLAPTDFLL